MDFIKILPEDLTLHILKLLDVADIGRLYSVNKKLSQLCNEERVWKSIYLNHWKRRNLPTVERESPTLKKNGISPFRIVNGKSLALSNIPSLILPRSCPSWKLFLQERKKIEKRLKLLDGVEVW